MSSHAQREAARRELGEQQAKLDEQRAKLYEDNLAAAHRNLENNPGVLPDPVYPGPQGVGYAEYPVVSHLTSARTPQYASLERDYQGAHQPMLLYRPPPSASLEPPTYYIQPGFPQVGFGQFPQAQAPPGVLPSVYWPSFQIPQSQFVAPARPNPLVAEIFPGSPGGTASSSNYPASDSAPSTSSQPSPNLPQQGGPSQPHPSEWQRDEASRREHALHRDDMMNPPERRGVRQKQTTSRRSAVEYLDRRKLGSLVSSVPDPNNELDFHRRELALSKVWDSTKKYVPHCHTRTMQRATDTITKDLPWVPKPLAQPNPVFDGLLLMEDANTPSVAPVGIAGLAPATTTGLAYETWRNSSDIVRPEVFPYIRTDTVTTSTVEKDLPYLRAKEGSVTPQAGYSGVGGTSSCEMTMQYLVNCGRNLTDPEAIPTNYIRTMDRLGAMIQDIKDNQSFGGLNPQALFEDETNAINKRPLITLGVSTFSTAGVSIFSGGEYDAAMHEVPPMLYAIDKDMERHLYPRHVRYRIPLLAERPETWNSRQLKLTKLGSGEQTVLDINSKEVKFKETPFIAMSPVAVALVGMLPHNVAANEFIRHLYISTVSGATWCIDMRELYQDNLKRLQGGQEGVANRVRLGQHFKEVSIPSDKPGEAEVLIQMDSRSEEEYVPLSSIPEILLEFLKSCFVVTWSEYDLRRLFIDTFGVFLVDRDQYVGDQSMINNSGFIPTISLLGALKDRPMSEINAVVGRHHPLPQSSVFAYAGALFGQGGMPRPILFLARLMALIGRYRSETGPLQASRVKALAADIFKAPRFQKIFVEYSILIDQYLAYHADLVQHQVRPRGHMQGLLTSLREAAQTKRTRCIELECVMVEMVVGEFNDSLRYDSPVFTGLLSTPTLVEYDLSVATRGAKALRAGNNCIYPLLDVLHLLSETIEEELVNPTGSQYAAEARDRQHLGEHKFSLMKFFEAEHLRNSKEVTEKMKQLVFRTCVENSLVIPVLYGLSLTKLIEVQPATSLAHLVQQARGIAKNPSILIHDCGQTVLDQNVLTTVDSLIMKFIRVIIRETRAFMYGKTREEQMTIAGQFGLFVEGWRIIFTFASTLFTHLSADGGYNTATLPSVLLWSLQRFYDTWLREGTFVNLVSPEAVQLDEPRVPLELPIPRSEGPEGLAVFTPIGRDYGFAKVAKPNMKPIIDAFHTWREKYRNLAQARGVRKHQLDDLRAMKQTARYKYKAVNQISYITAAQPPEYYRTLGTNIPETPFVPETEWTTSISSPQVTEEQSRTATVQPSTSHTVSQGFHTMVQPSTETLKKASEVIQVLLVPKTTKTQTGATMAEEVSETPSATEQTVPMEETAPAPPSEDYNHTLQELLNRSPEFLSFTRFQKFRQYPIQDFHRFRQMLFDSQEEHIKFTKDQCQQWDCRRDFLVTPIRIEAILGPSYRDRFAVEQSYRGKIPTYQHMALVPVDRPRDHPFSGSLTKLAKENPILFMCLESRVLNRIAIDELATQLLIIQNYWAGHTIPMKPSVQHSRYADTMYGHLPYAMFGKAREEARMSPIHQYEEDGYATWRQLEMSFGPNLDSYQYPELSYTPSEEGVPSMELRDVSPKDLRDRPNRHVGYTTLKREIDSFWGDDEIENLPAVQEKWKWLNQGYPFNPTTIVDGGPIEYKTGSSTDQSVSVDSAGGHAGIQKRPHPPTSDESAHH